MTAKRDVTNAGLYDRLDSLRLEFKQDINVAVNTVAISQGRLEKKFDDLEAGRLTRAEGYINDLRLQIQNLSNKQTASDRQNQSAEKALSGKFLALGTIALLILSSLSSAFFMWIFVGRHK